MRIRKKIDFVRLGIMLSFAFVSICLFFVLDNGEPFSLLLLYAMLQVGLPTLPSAFVGFLPCLFSQNAALICLYAAQTVLMAIAFWIHNKKYKHRAPLLPMFALTLVLVIFVVAAPFNGYVLPTPNAFIDNILVQKIVLAAFFFVIAAIFSIAAKCILKKFLHCRLRSDELVFTIFSLCLVGVGFCRFLSVNAYLGTAFLFLLVFTSVTKDPSCLLCAFCLSLPPFILTGQSIEKFFVFGVAVLLFARFGRLAIAFALLAVFFAFGYFEGLFSYPTGELVASLLSALLPALLFMLIPAPILRALEQKVLFYREKHLSRIAINRNRAAIGEKLFELSAVFREIQATFNSLGSAEAETHAKEYIRNCVIDEVCKKCPQYLVCARKNPLPWITNLIDVGCLKGKATLLDIPKKLAENCNFQSEMLYALNKQLAEYHAYATEAENTATGRGLLAGQAQGVSEILKNLALEQSEPLRLYTDKERALCAALLNVGIVCAETLIYGEEDNLTLSLVTFGKADVKKIAAVATHTLGEAMAISERIALSGDKYCCILRKRTTFDAAFGISTAQKAGEIASGDTHSVIKIDERRFMVALVDGMGSGEYAHKISASTISLLESFYRAKMPPPLILSTVNKLLTFSKEESFACVDVAIVDLTDGRADIVKIGSPLAFILSGNTVKVLESASLPLGILDNLRPDVSTYTLNENDVLLFVSDGVTDAFGGAADLYETLRSIPTNNPQQLADTLVQSALQAYRGKAKDDVTAVAVRIFKNRAS